MAAIHEGLWSPICIVLFLGLLHKGQVLLRLQENLDDASKENRQLADELEQLESENTELHSASHELDRVTAELTGFQQQAQDSFDSLAARGQQEVDALHSTVRQLQRQLQSSHAQVHALRDQLERAQNYIQALQNQSGAGPEGRAAPEQGMRLPRPVRTSSLTGSLRSPRSPGGSSTSSTTSSRRNNDFQVRCNARRLCFREYWLLWPRSQLQLPMHNCITCFLQLPDSAKPSASLRQVVCAA